MYIMQIIRRLESELEHLCDDNGHSIYHLRRVLNNAVAIHKIEGGDKTVIEVSALLHDVHRIIQKKTGEFCPPEASLPEVSRMLEVVELDDEIKQRVLHCISHHEEYDFSPEGKNAEDIETLILQDADNLDAIGAIGTARAFCYGAGRRPMWDPDIPFDREQFEEAVDDPSTIHHFYSKLLKLKDDFNTDTAKEMARERHKFMESFLDEFFTEWKGEK